MLAPQKRRRVARVLVELSDSENDVTINKIENTDDDDDDDDDDDCYEPSPAKKTKVSQKKAVSKRAAAEPPKRKTKLEKKTKIGTISSDDKNDIGWPYTNIQKERKRAKATSTKESAQKRAKFVASSSDISDGVSSSKSTEMGLFSSKSATKKPNTDAVHDVEQPKRKMYTATGSSWTADQLLSNLQNIDRSISCNIIRLFEQENTIPFICRYRRELIGNMEPDRLRDIKVTYNHIKNIQSRAQTILKDLTTKNVLTEEIRCEIVGAKCLDELDHLYAPYKTESKATLAERAKALGLEDVTLKILAGDVNRPNLSEFLNASVAGLESVDKIKEGIQHIIAQIFSKDIDVLETISQIIGQRNNGISIQTRKNTSAAAAKAHDKSTKHGHGKKEDDASKFEIYFQNELKVNWIKPHQWLAINRGECLKYLTVKVMLPQSIQMEIFKRIRSKFFDNGSRSTERDDLLNNALDEAWTKKISLLITRQIRSLLSKEAEKASIDVFALNLKQLLLLHPMKGKKILGIDPGFTNGCKIALISECNDVLETTVIYPHTQRAKSMLYGKQIANLMMKHKCELIALGNGTACRETETWITELMKQQILDSNSTKYCIVSECGASIYSCSEVAKNEFPDLDVNLISAVSIARRLSDPLAELVKVDAKHLGVGMYQHDVNEKLLTESLNEVVMECASFVGVDLNTASVTLLRHIAGLNASRAENIIKYRTANGSFKSRDELLKVISIGPVSFHQCAGFVRIEPLTANISVGSPKYCVLDSTWVHPESYDVAKKLIKKLGFTMREIGAAPFIAKIRHYLEENESNMDRLGSEYGIPGERLRCILEALSRELNRDYRDDTNVKPLFKSGVRKMIDLKEGTMVTGAISNITPFGCFVDIGVERNGLIHVSKLGGETPKVGDHVTAEVLQVDKERNRIQLRLECIQ